MHEVDGVVRLSLAVSLAIKHFQHIVEGHSFYISLTTNICSVYLSPLRQIQYLDYISQFMSNICHIQRSCNAAADALFCIHLESNALLNYSRTVLHMGVVLLGMGIVLDMGEVIPGTDKEVVQAVYHMRYWTISAYR